MAVDIPVPAPLPVVCPWIDSPFFPAEVERRAPEASRRRVATELHEKGFAVLPAVAAPQLVDRILNEVESLLDLTGKPVVADAWDRGCPAVRQLAVQPEVVDLLRFLFDRRPIPFRTLSARRAVGRRPHADGLQYSTLPARFLCGVWVALQDTDDGNGPLYFYPGSHRLPEVTLYDLGQTVDGVDQERYEDHQEALMDALGIEPEEVHVGKGDAVLWASNTVHGERPSPPSGRTRWSQVTHYVFDDSVYYASARSDLVGGELALRDVVDLTTLQPVPHRYGGEAVTILPGAGGRSRVITGAAAGEDSDHVGVLRARIDDLEDLVHDRDEQITLLLSSQSYRIGRRLVAPVARARDALRPRRRGRAVGHHRHPH